MKKLINGILIITSSSIGAGILGMPITCNLAGLIPSIIIMIFITIYMNVLAKIIIELFFLTNINDINTILNKITNKKYYIISNIIYCFLFTSIMTAYISKSSEIIQILIFKILNIKITMNLCYLIISFIICIIINIKNSFFNYTNKILTIFLILIFLIILTQYSNSKIEMQNLLYINTYNMQYVYQILITSFGFHNILPYIKKEYGNDKKSINKIINIGMIITLSIYMIWIFLIISTNELSDQIKNMENYKSDKIITDILTNSIKSNKLVLTLNIFSLIAIITSIFSIGISMKIFFQKRMQTDDSKLITCLIIIPPIMLIKLQTNVFFTALEISGSILTLIIFGILPIKALKIIKNTSLFKINLINILTLMIILISIIIQLNK